MALGSAPWRVLEEIAHARPVLLALRGAETHVFDGVREDARTTVDRRNALRIEERLEVLCVGLVAEGAAHTDDLLTALVLGKCAEDAVVVRLDPRPRFVAERR